MDKVNECEDYKSELIKEIEKLSSTISAQERVRRNLSLEQDVDIINHLKEMVKNSCNGVTKGGKNYYADCGDYILTIAAKSVRLITAHTKKEEGESKVDEIVEEVSNIVQECKESINGIEVEDNNEENLDFYLFGKINKNKLNYNEELKRLENKISTSISDINESEVYYDKDSKEVFILDSKNKNLIDLTEEDLKILCECEAIDKKDDSICFEAKKVIDSVEESNFLNEPCHEFYIPGSNKSHKEKNVLTGVFDKFRSSK